MNNYRIKTIPYQFRENVVGLDGSLKGFGVVVGGPGRPTELLTLTPKTRGPERLVFLCDSIQDILANREDSLILIENYPPNPHGASNLFQMGQLHGVLETMFYREDKRYVYTTPQQVKKFLAGKATAKKSDLSVHALKKWGLDKTEGVTEDEIDAFILAKIAEAYLEPSYCEAEYQREVLDAIRKYSQKNYPWIVERDST